VMRDGVADAGEQLGKSSGVNLSTSRNSFCGVSSV
jgi:hypothetical protein